MKKPPLAALVSVAVLTLLILAIVVNSKRSPSDRATAGAADRATELNSPAKKTSLARTEATAQAPNSTLKNAPTPLANRTVSSPSKSLPRQVNPRTARTKDPTRVQAQAHEFTSKLLSRSEEYLTREVLPDGAEIIHLNGTHGHLSSASIAADGTITTACHGAPENALNQGALNQNLTTSNLATK